MWSPMLNSESYSDIIKLRIESKSRIENEYLGEIAERTIFELLQYQLFEVVRRTTLREETLREGSVVEPPEHVLICSRIQSYV